MLKQVQHEVSASFLFQTLKQVQGEDGEGDRDTSEVNLFPM